MTDRKEEDEKRPRGDQAQQGEEGDGEELPPLRRPSRLEHAVSIASGLLVLGVLAALVWDAAHEDTPAALAVSADSVHRANGAYEMDVTIRNTGDRAAKDVLAHLRLTEGDSTLDEAELSVDWLPGHSRHHAIAVFRTDPRQHRVVAEIRGFDDP